MLTLTQPDDWHLHLRDGQALTETVPASSRCFGRAIVMPNLSPPVTTPALALAYYQRIQAHIPAGSNFTPLMTLYLTDQTTPDLIKAAAESPIIHAAKLYPCGSTTHAQSGVTNIPALYPVFETMAEQGMPLLIHGEVVDDAIDIFDREAVFIERHLQPLLQALPTLKVVLEHITTADAVDFVAQASNHVGATITVHHLMYERNALLAGGIRPHYYCLPILKRKRHQEALIAAATSGNPKYFLGTDSAPHPRHAKESACGCAGIYSAPAAIELYAQVFEQAGALPQLEGFASHHGADFYGLPRHTGKIQLEKKSWEVPASLDLGTNTVIPLCASESITWQLV